MRKWLLLLLGMVGVPCLICVIVCAIVPQLVIGQGDRNMETCHMGQEILVEIDGIYKPMDVEEYVLGILAGVISPDYEEETLKLQAVLIRTNLLKEMKERGTKDAEDIPYTYISVEERKEMWGERNYERQEKRFERAVMDTAGKVLAKEGNLIMACYHEVSIGKTASAKEILGEEVSYLQSVESSRDVEAKHYMNLVEYSEKELAECVNQWNTAADTNGEKEGKDTDTQREEQQEIAVEIEESTKNGFVKKIRVNGDSYTGEEAMQMFHLPSLNFYVEKREEGLRFVCLGTGNCLGVSQYGANRMAKEGKTMKEILDYYYQNVSLVSYKEVS